MTLERVLSHDDVTTALGYDPQANLSVLDLVVNRTDSLASAWSATSGSVGATVGTLGSGAMVVRTKKIGRTVTLQAHITVNTQGTGSGALTAILPFASAVDCVLSGYENTSKLAVTVFLIANSTQAVLRTYNGSFPGVTGANVYFHGTYESVS